MPHLLSAVRIKTSRVTWSGGRCWDAENTVHMQKPCWDRWMIVFRGPWTLKPWLIQEQWLQWQLVSSRPWLRLFMRFGVTCWQGWLPAMRVHTHRSKSCQFHFRSFSIFHERYTWKHHVKPEVCFFFLRKKKWTKVKLLVN